VEEARYQVLLEGRKVGPYDRRTIVGMRIKKTLTSEHVLIGTDGAQITVAQLIGQRPIGDFNPDRSGSFSVVQATFSGSVIEVEGKELGVPAFKDEVEIRVQGAVLRIAGRFRKGFGWKEDRVKLPLADVVHARINGTQVDLWLRAGDGVPLRRVTLELFTHETAGDLVEWLPGATPWPGGDAKANGPAQRGDGRMLWVAGGLAVVVVVVVLLVLVALLQRRVY
jgi:hypothetical protein